MTTFPYAQVTVVSVSYNSVAVLPVMLASLPKGTPVVVVDNASADVSALQDLCKEYAAQIIYNSENKGFGVACNQGAAGVQTEFLLFLNPDATLKPDTLDHLIAAARRYPLASAMNPRIARDDGKPLFHRRSRLMPVSEYMPKGWPDADREVTVLVGSALFVRRADFEAVGGFDPQIFLYHEDDDLSRRLRATCGPIMFIRDAFVEHLAGKSSPPSLQTVAFKEYHKARSRVYTARKHHRGWPFATALIAGLLGLLAPDMLTSARRRAKHWGAVKGVLSTWGDGGAGRSKR